MLEHHFVIRNLPPKLEKNSAITTVIKLGQILGITFNAHDFSTQPYFVQQKNQSTSTIIGAFFDERVKHQLFVNHKEKRPVPVEDICFGIPLDSPFRDETVQDKWTKRSFQVCLGKRRPYPSTLHRRWETNSAAKH